MTYQHLCQMPTQSGRPCRNRVSKRGGRCHVHARSRAKKVRRAVGAFWSSLKAADTLRGLLEWCHLHFAAAAKDPFATAWSTYRAERRRREAGKPLWLPPGTLDRVEAEVEAAIAALPGAELDRLLSRHHVGNR